MRVYVDSSALLKRVFDEPESAALVEHLEQKAAGDALLISSSLAWVEVSRAVRAAPGGSRRGAAERRREAEDVALSGIHEAPITAAVIALARRLDPAVLRSLDAVHLATALVIDADAVIAYDGRLLDAARANHVPLLSPT